MKTIVWITTQFTGFHSWDRAPDSVAFLRHKHRHLFHVKIGVEVKHSDRDVEFFLFKKEVDSFLKKEYEGKYFDCSCEHIASILLNKFEAYFVEVSEDGENGAIVSRE